MEAGLGSIGMAVVEAETASIISMHACWTRESKFEMSSADEMNSKISLLEKKKPSQMLCDVSFNVTVFKCCSEKILDVFFLQCT